MKSTPPHAVPLLATLLLGLLVRLPADTGSLSAIGSMPRISITTSSASLEGYAALTVRCRNPGAEIFLDRQYAGLAPVTLARLAPGGYQLRINAEGYFPLSVELTLAANTGTELTVDLVSEIGYVNISTNIDNITIVHGGREYGGGPVPLPSGLRELYVRAFGYREERLEVYVMPSVMTEKRLILEPADFSVDSAAASRAVFNPRNAGSPGSVQLSYRASNRGTADYAVLDGKGNTVLESGPHSLETWQQSFVWDGRDSAGKLVPDGVYRLTARIEPAPEVVALQESYLLEFPVTVDQTLVISPAGNRRITSGPANSYTAWTPASSKFAWGLALLFGARVPADPQLEFGLRGSLSLAELAEFGLGFELGGREGSLRLQAEARAGIWETAIGGLPFGIGAAIAGTVSAEPQIQPHAIRLAFPLSIGTRFLSFSLGPELDTRIHETVAFHPGASVALSASGFRFGAELSARFNTGAIGGPQPGLSWPIAVGLDLTLLQDQLPVAATLHAGVQLAPSYWTWSTGLLLNLEMTR